MLMSLNDDANLSVNHCSKYVRKCGKFAWTEHFKSQ